MTKYPMTLRGAELLKEELRVLKTEKRPRIVKDIAEAREHGDLKENAEYHAAKEKLAIIDSQIAELGAVISKAVIIDPSTLPHSRVSFGSTIEIVDIHSDEEFSYAIVGGVESNADKGLISFNSPLAKQLLGKEEGDEIKANLPGGVKTFEILSVSYKELSL